MKLFPKLRKAIAKKSISSLFYCNQKVLCSEINRISGDSRQVKVVFIAFWFFGVSLNSVFD